MPMHAAAAHCAVRENSHQRFWRRSIFDADPKRADHADYVQQLYTEIERRFQAGMTQLQFLPIHAV